jgi:hypothetical protein
VLPPYILDRIEVYIFKYETIIHFINLKVIVPPFMPLPFANALFLAFCDAHSVE